MCVCVCVCVCVYECMCVCVYMCTRRNLATTTAYAPHPPHQHNLLSRYSSVKLVRRPTAGARAVAPLLPILLSDAAHANKHHYTMIHARLPSPHICAPAATQQQPPSSCPSSTPCLTATQRTAKVQFCQIRQTAMRLKDVDKLRNVEIYYISGN